MKLKLSLLAITALALVFPWHSAQSVDTTQYWLKVRTKNKFERNVVANIGAAIEVVGKDFVLVSANVEEKAQLDRLGWVVESNPLTALDFPNEDREFHNYSGAQQVMQSLVQEFPGLVKMVSIGKSVQGRDIWSMVLSKDVEHSSGKPAVLYVGGHHSREHLSVEIPLRFAQWLMTGYKNGDARAIKDLETRQIHIIPMMNPDGLEYDIAGNQYKAWRKNMRPNSDGTTGVDPNRNYSFQWGTGGSSSNPGSETYMGPKPFSEPETLAMKNYIEANKNIRILLSFHTYSELILYPWGHSESGIPDARDKMVHEVMAQKMSEWNHYTPEQTSQLYVASGDLTDWAYGEHKIISFTFEMDPSANEGFGTGGFYPGQAVIQPVLEKNIEPIMYLIDYADNPYRVLPTAR